MNDRAITLYQKLKPKILHLQTLKLTNFKNYEAQTLQLSAKLNTFVGKNGMGKTNLLDAIYYLCMCKSHFGINDRFVVRHGASFFRLEGIFLKNEKKETIVGKVIPRKRKEVERNKLVYKRLADHIGFIPVVMIAPDDTQLAKEGSEERRRFLDNTICQMDAIYLQKLIKYNKILAQRNKLLKQFGEASVFDPLLIESYDQQLTEPATYICKKRQEIAKLFVPIFKQYYGVISGHQEEVSCIYQSKLIDTDFKTLLRQQREKDRILQRTTIGIHRDDLIFSINGFSAKRLASQGQLKSFILALKLAQYELLRQQKGVTPLLLLDDIFDKLDASRVEHLLELLIEQKEFGQVFITDTHKDRIMKIVTGFGTDFRQFEIEAGSIKL